MHTVSLALFAGYPPHVYYTTKDKPAYLLIAVDVHDSVMFDAVMYRVLMYMMYLLHIDLTDIALCIRDNPQLKLHDDFL